MAGARKARGPRDTQVKAGTQKEGSAMRIAGVEDVPEEVTSKEDD